MFVVVHESLLGVAGRTAKEGLDSGTSACRREGVRGGGRVARGRVGGKEGRGGGEMGRGGGEEGR